MSQRNPMNDRYQGDGPQGKTRKSAAKLKPKADAAGSVHIDKKPTTKAERKAARKKRDAQIAAKEAERKRKAAERERKARLEAGEVVEEPKKATAVDRVKNFVAPPKTTSSANKGTSIKPGDRVPKTPEYRRLKTIYWSLMGVGVVSIGISFYIQTQVPELMDGWGMMVPLAIAYITVIGAIVLDFAKIRKLQKAHERTFTSGKSSPKQLKHEQQKAEAAALLEEKKKAQSKHKRVGSLLPFNRSSAEDAGSDAAEESEEDVLDEIDYEEDVSEEIDSDEGDFEEEDFEENDSDEDDFEESDSDNRAAGESTSEETED